MPEERPQSTVQQRLARVLSGPAAAGPGAGRGRHVGDRPIDGPLRGASVGGSVDGEPAGEPGGGVAARLGGAAAAFDPGRRGLRVVAVVAVLVALAAAGVAWRSRPVPEPVVPQVAGTGKVVASASAPVELVVAVSGLVHRPGLVRLPPGARVADAIEAAGGALPDADLDHLNLARKVADGELIAVGIPPPPPGDPAGSPDGGPVDLNTASAAQLETLPGIGPTLARRIIDYRTTHGPFASVEQLREVPGIGEARFAELAPLVTV